MVLWKIQIHRNTSSLHNSYRYHERAQMPNKTMNYACFLTILCVAIFLSYVTSVEGKLFWSHHCTPIQLNIPLIHIYIYVWSYTLQTPCSIIIGAFPYRQKRNVKWDALKGNCTTAQDCSTIQDCNESTKTCTLTWWFILIMVVLVLFIGCVIVCCACCLLPWCICHEVCKCLTCGIC